MHREIAKVVGEAVATVVRDLETTDKVVCAIKAGLARVRARDAAAEAEKATDPRAQAVIAALKEACGVTPRLATAQSTNPKAAYLAGVLDGFRLSWAETQDDAEALIDAINKGDVDARIRAARARK